MATHPIRVNGFYLTGDSDTLIPLYLDWDDRRGWGHYGGFRSCKNLTIKVNNGPNWKITTVRRIDAERDLVRIQAAAPSATYEDWYLDFDNDDSIADRHGSDVVLLTEYRERWPAGADWIAKDAPLGGKYLIATTGHYEKWTLGISESIYGGVVLKHPASVPTEWSWGE